MDPSIIAITNTIIFIVIHSVQIVLFLSDNYIV